MNVIFTTKAEYGVRLLVELGRHGVDSGTGGCVSLKALAEAENLPLGYLEHVVALLRKAGLVESTRGARGGYRLAREPETITMDEVVLVLEGAIAPMDCFFGEAESRVSCSHLDDHGSGCATKFLWTKVQMSVVDTLKRTTLADLVLFATPRERELTTLTN
jgi:Rrf2 family cysteine metabolism transcriptional repressor